VMALVHRLIHLPKHYSAWLIVYTLTPVINKLLTFGEVTKPLLRVQLHKLLVETQALAQTLPVISTLMALLLKLSLVIRL